MELCEMELRTKYQDTEPVARVCYRLPEVMAATGLSKSKVYGLVARGELPSRKIGKKQGHHGS